jgi:hypothetical protein
LKTEFNLTPKEITILIIATLLTMMKMHKGIPISALECVDIAKEMIEYTKGRID